MVLFKNFAPVAPVAAGEDGAYDLAGCLGS